MNGSSPAATPADAAAYLEQAQRDAVRLDAEAAPRAVRSVAVIGAGTMGSGIAIAALQAGFEVILVDLDDDSLQRGQARIVDHFRRRVDAGKLLADEAVTSLGRLTASADWNLVARVDLVIEAVFEDLAVKQAVFARLDSVARHGAVLATNTSYLDIDAIAGATSRPHDVLGLHFFSPAQVMKLVEVIRGAATAPDVMATGMAVAACMGKTPVPAGNAFGFIGNRVYNAYRRDCEFMLEDGAWPEDVDRALTTFGFAMGPFAVADLSGLDIAWRMRKAQAATRDPRTRYVDILDRLCEMGRMGRKTGCGYYVYTNGRPAEASDETVRAVIAQASARRGVQRRDLGGIEIQRRALAAMLNEAALLCSQGVAARPSDIDVVLTLGYGFPRAHGGLVCWARHQDRRRLRADLEALSARTGHGFVAGDVDRLLDTA